MPRPTTIAILPVKRFARAKQRLDPALSPAQRQELAGAMVADVLDALTRARGIDGVIVVSGEPLAVALAAAAGAVTVSDENDSGQSAAAVLGIARAIELGAERVLLVPGDCPTLDAEEVSGLLEAADPAPSVTIVPDRHGSGTNALVMSPPDALDPSFGPGSRSRHVSRAEQSGAKLRVADVPSLSLDVDTGGDLEALRERLALAPGGAARTRAVLDSVVSEG